MENWFLIFVTIGLGYLFLAWGEGLPVITTLRNHIDPDKFLLYSLAFVFLFRAAWYTYYSSKPQTQAPSMEQAEQNDSDNYYTPAMKALLAKVNH